MVKEFIRILVSTFCTKKYKNHAVQIMYNELKWQHTVGSDMCLQHVCNKELILFNLCLCVCVFIIFYVLLRIWSPLLTSGILQTFLTIYFLYRIRCSALVLLDSIFLIHIFICDYMGFNVPFCLEVPLSLRAIIKTRSLLLNSICGSISIRTYLASILQNVFL